MTEKLLLQNNKHDKRRKGTAGFFETVSELMGGRNMDMPVNTYTTDYKSQVYEYRMINFEENLIAAKLNSISERLEALEHQLKITHQDIMMDLIPIEKEIRQLMSDIYGKKYNIKQKTRIKILDQVGILQEKVITLLKQNRLTRAR